MATGKVQSTLIGSFGQSPEVSAEPWWKVRSSLALALACCFLVAVLVYRWTAGSLGDWTWSGRSLAQVLSLLSSTPTLATISLLACLLMNVRGQGRFLRTLCAVLVFAGLLGAGLNVVRARLGNAPFEALLEKAVPDSAAEAE